MKTKKKIIPSCHHPTVTSILNYASLFLNDFFVSRVKGGRMEIVSNFPKRLFPHLWDHGANWTVASSSSSSPSMLPLPFNERRRRRRRRRRAFSPLFPRGHYHYVHHHHLLMGKASGGMAERKFIRARFPCAMCKVDKLYKNPLKNWSNFLIFR